MTACNPEGQPTILLAEDDEGVRNLIVAVLQKSGCTLLTAVDGKQALELSRSHNGKIHLLLADVCMPEMTGIELATQLSIERPDTSILIMSGFASGLKLDDGWEFVRKPFVPNMLRDKIYALLHQPPESNSPRSKVA